MAGEATTSTGEPGRISRSAAGESLAQPLGMTGMLKNQRALQVLGTVQPACQAEMPLKMRACLAKDFEDLAFLRCHKSLLYH